jgi:hypothetical protein
VIAANDRKEQSLRIGVAGCGRFFERFHLPALRISRHWQLVAACDTSPERRQWAESSRRRSVDHSLDFRGELFARNVAGYGAKYRERLEIKVPGRFLLVHPGGMIESRITSLSVKRICWLSRWRRPSLRAAPGPRFGGPVRESA